MDTGQISQGLRADTMQQMQGQGINVGQMMQSGVSFADILLMLAAGSQGMAMAPGMMGAPQGSIMDQQMNGEMMGMGTQDGENMLSMLSDPKNLMESDSLMQFMQGQASLADGNVRQQVSELLSFMSGDEVQQPNAEEAVTAENLQPVAEQSVKTVQSDEAEQQVAEAESAGTEATDIAKPADAPVKTDGSIKADKAEDNAADEEKTVSKSDETVDVPAKKLDISEGKRPKITHEETDNAVAQTGGNYAPKGMEKVTDGKSVRELNRDYKPQTETVNEGEKETTETKQSQKNFNIPETKTVSAGEKKGFVYRDAGLTDDLLDDDEGIAVYDPALRQQIEKIFKGIDPRLKSTEGIVPRKFAMADMKAIPQTLLKTAAAELRGLSDLTQAKTVVPDTGEELTNGQKFVIGLLGNISQKDTVRDSFDFSENIVKADPMQLAGLLDFIRTGVGIPLISDIADREEFKNINTVGSISAERLFDPNEMIKSGEMEIISYTPPVKNENSQQQEQGFGEALSHRETIGMARTMKSVRENVEPFIFRDEDEDISTEQAARMTPHEMLSTARRVDISFDRALAELEMNKAEYGEPNEQVAKGVAENILRGRSEFTVKLRPEGLGEILVRLVSDDAGKTVLSMVASSQRTADLLNKDLASLQSSLGSQNVEIENNSVKVAETVMPAEHQSNASFDQYDERRRDEGQQENRYREVRKKLNTDEIRVGSTDFDRDVAVGKSAANDSMLNISI